MDEHGPARRAADARRAAQGHRAGDRARRTARGPRRGPAHHLARRRRGARLPRRSSSGSPSSTRFAWPMRRTDSPRTTRASRSARRTRSTTRTSPPTSSPIPSLYEGFGNALLEALFYGVPVAREPIPGLRGRHRAARAEADRDRRRDHRRDGRRGPSRPGQPRKATGVGTRTTSRSRTSTCPTACSGASSAGCSANWSARGLNAVRAPNRPDSHGVTVRPIVEGEPSESATLTWCESGRAVAVAGPTPMA